MAGQSRFLQRITSFHKNKFKYNLLENNFKYNEINLNTRSHKKSYSVNIDLYSGLIDLVGLAQRNTSFLNIEKLFFIFYFQFNIGTNVTRI